MTRSDYIIVGLLIVAWWLAQKGVQTASKEPAPANHWLNWPTETLNGGGGW